MRYFQINMNTNSLTFITLIHGNEPIPSLALARLRLPHIIANPQAASREARFIDHDLNQAFGVPGQGYEFRRARQLLRQIPPDATVIDFHTFSCRSAPFAIVVDPALIPLARATGLRHLVLMRHNIKQGHSLINHRRGVSVEVGRHHTYSAFQTTIKVIRNLQPSQSGVIPTCLASPLAGPEFNTQPNHYFTKTSDNSARIYQVYDVIKKPGKYHNFHPHPTGFIPVLAGEQAYPFPGLKARIISS
jgi:hypothetical protein